MTFKEANGILAHMEKYSGLKIESAKEAFGVICHQSICNFCYRNGSCSAQDRLNYDETVEECNFYTEDETPEEDYETLLEATE